MFSIFPSTQLHAHISHYLLLILPASITIQFIGASHRDKQTTNELMEISQKHICISRELGTQSCTYFAHLINLPDVRHRVTLTRNRAHVTIFHFGASPWQTMSHVVTKEYTFGITRRWIILYLVVSCGSHHARVRLSQNAVHSNWITALHGWHATSPAHMKQLGTTPRPARSFDFPIFNPAIRWHAHHSKQKFKRARAAMQFGSFCFR